MEGRAKAAEEYPDQLCRAICRGMRKQQSYDKTGLCSLLSLSSQDLERAMTASGMPAHWTDQQHEDLHEDELLQREIQLLRMKNGEIWARDDVSGVELDAKKLQEARGLEMAYFRNMQVYVKVMAAPPHLVKKTNVVFVFLCLPKGFACLSMDAICFSWLFLLVCAMALRFWTL